MIEDEKPKQLHRLGDFVRRNSLPLFIAVLVLQSAIMSVLVDESRTAVDALDQQVDTDGARSCDRAVVAAMAANQQVVASAAIARAVALNTASVNVSVQALVDAFRSLSPGGQLGPEGEAVASTLVATVGASTDAVDAQLGLAVVALDAALRDVRDCSQIATDPDAVLSPPTLPPILLDE